MSATEMGAICGWGFAVPRRRLPNAAVAEAWGRPPLPGARAIAGHDEDALTLGVQAALEAVGCLPEPSAVGALLFASTTAPYAERSSARLIGDVLGLGPAARCIDLGGSLRAGCSALAAACDLVAGGACRRVLVVAADCRVAAPGAPDEILFGHAGVALVIGPAAAGATHTPGVTACIVARAEHGTSQLDTWRSAGARFPRSGDARSARQGAYAAPMGAVLAELLERSGWSPGEVGKVVPYSPDVKSAGALLKRSGFDLKRQYCDLASPHLGLTGAAHTPLMLAAALEKSARGERALALGYGDGAAGFALEMAADPGRALYSAARKQGYEIGYNRYLALHQLHAGESGASSGGGFTSEIMEERNKALWFGLRARRCAGCGAIITLPLPGCPHCAQQPAAARGGRQDQPPQQPPPPLEEVELARHGMVFAITHEHYFPTPEPPLGMAAVDLEGGGRLTLQVADEDVPLAVGDPVELVFRRLHDAGGRPNYFWKCRRRVRGGAPATGRPPAPASPEVQHAG